MTCSSAGFKTLVVRRLAILLLTTQLIPGVQAEDRPNILLLMAEDLSPRIGAFGDKVAITPNLDQLAAEGIRYTNVFTSAGVCAPSRAAIIMGMHQESFGAQHMRSYKEAPAAYRPVPPAHAKAFPELLRAAGYHTFVTTKLDYQFSGTRPGTGPFSIWDSEAASGGYETPPRQPFFGYITYMETHESGLFPRWTWPSSQAHLMAQLMHIWYHRSTEDQVFAQDIEVPPYYPDTTAIRQDIARLYNNVITMDKGVGEVVKALEADGLADNTIIIWTTDHGDALPRAKRELYDSGLHVPLIVRWPEKFRPDGAVPGSVNDRLVSLVDLAPTLLSLAGADIPEYHQGSVFLGNSKAPPRQYVFAGRDRIDKEPDNQRAVRDERYKYIFSGNTRAGGFHLAYRDLALGMQDLWQQLEAGNLNDVQMQWFRPRPSEMLFDTQTDPHEINNLAANPEYQHILQRMRTAASDHHSKVYDYSAEMTEADMAEQFWPGGIQPVTATPVISRETDGQVSITSDTKDASIGYRLEDGPWGLYTGPFSIKADSQLEAKAVRYGWAPSDVIEVQ